MANNSHVSFGPMLAIGAMVVVAVLWNRFTASEAYRKRDYFTMYFYAMMVVGVGFTVWSVLRFVFS